MNRGQRRANWRATHRLALSQSHTAGRAAATPAPAAMRVHISELVLHGFASSSRHAIAEATQEQLTALFRMRGLPAQFSSSQNRDFVDGGSFQMAPSARPVTIGSFVADAVYGENR